MVGCETTTCSKTFARNSKLEMEWCLLEMSGLRPGIFRIGVTATSFKGEVMTRGERGVDSLSDEGNKSGEAGHEKRWEVSPVDRWMVPA